MKSISRNSFWFMASISVLFIPADRANALFGIGDVVTDPVLTAKSVAAEAARLGQTATMIQNQVNAYQNMIRNTIGLANPVLEPVGALARSGVTAYYRAQNLMYQAENPTAAFGGMYPGSLNFQAYAMNIGRGGQTLESKYQDWSQNGYSNVRSALVAANMQAENMEKENTTLDKLNALTLGTGGQVQALQGIGQVMGQQSAQLNGLQGLQLTQVRMMANYYGAEIDRQTAFDSTLVAFKTPRAISRSSTGY
jgi:P-type conjugative transfer protein TrbJ